METAISSGVSHERQTALPSSEDWQGPASFATLFLKTKELSGDLVVGGSAEVWPRMRNVPRIFPIAKKQRKRFDPSQYPDITNRLIEI
jgi:hypothetical protein